MLTLKIPYLGTIIELADSSYMSIEKKIVEPKDNRYVKFDFIVQTY